MQNRLEILLLNEDKKQKSAEIESASKFKSKLLSR